MFPRFSRGSCFPNCSLSQITLGGDVAPTVSLHCCLFRNQWRPQGVWRPDVQIPEFLQPVGQPNRGSWLTGFLLFPLQYSRDFHHILHYWTRHVEILGQKNRRDRHRYLLLVRAQESNTHWRIQQILRAMQESLMQREKESQASFCELNHEWTFLAKSLTESK